MSRPVLLDTSFLVAILREFAAGEQGPARRFLPSLRGRQLVISIVSVEELLEGAADETATVSALQRFTIQGTASRSSAPVCAPAAPRATPDG